MYNCKPSLENAARNADQLFRVSIDLAGAVDLANSMARNGWAAIAEESAAYELLAGESDGIIRALREIAVRLDRSVVSRL